ncbi:Toll/interleukin-1 receptor domain-containing protein [Tanacetum coccineum]
MVSASTSSILNSFKYDVFLSFRGEDTRKNFVDHLYHALMGKGIYTYRDDENIQKGARISDDLFKSIQDSKFYIIVFSKNYASSSWCLEELVKIMECQKMTGHTAYPVFYDVEPTEVRKQIGAVGKAFAKHKKEAAARKWREALKEAADLAGFELESMANGREAKFIQFDGASFIYNVQEVSKVSSEGLKKLQKEVVSEVLKDKNIDVSGNSMMQRRMRGIKVLIVLDDVDHKDQLEALAGDLNWFKPGSRIIITTRDKQVLTAHGVELIHNATLLSQAEAGCLFSRYAFGRQNPIQGYEELSGKVLQYAGGLPLTIKVMGSHLRGLDESEWKNAIKRLETIPFKGTMKVLELSYDGMEEDCKQIFLDVACILKGEYKKSAIRMLESRGFYGIYGLRVLEQKSLITYNEDGRLWMHDHLEEMGRNIVRRSHPDEPQRYSRLWDKEEIEYILTNELGTPATQCLYFYSRDFSAEIAIKGLAKMKDLKVLDIVVSNERINWVFDKVSEYLPSSLRYIRWWSFPFSSLPNTFQGKHLVNLEMYNSNIVQLWEDGEGKVLNNLRFLKIWHSMLRTFDLRLAPNLESLTIENCKDFVKLHIPADHHSKLEYLDLSNSKLTNLHLGNAPNLKTLKLDSCHNLVFQMPSESLKLEQLDLSYLNLTNLHLGNTPNLKMLNLNSCNDLVEFQMPAESLKLEHLHLSFLNLTNLHLGNTPNLKTLKLNSCNDLVLLPELGRVKCLKMLNILGTGIRRLPQSILQLKGLCIIGSREILESCGLKSKIPTSGGLYEEIYCYI